MTSVVKLGGSLLSQPDWPGRLKYWLDCQPVDDYCLIVGGGGVIDAMRELDSVHRLSGESMHWRCIRLLDATYEIAAELLPDAIKCDCLEDLKQKLAVGSPSEKRLFLTRVAGFYTPADLSPCSKSLPIGWETTTDTLAAFLGILIHAEQVVLLKSCRIAEGLTLFDAAEQGVVDSAICSLERDIEIEIQQLPELQ
jgi:5-(aminomethyl)-3-furanmethanol phosphate kinase